MTIFYKSSKDLTFFALRDNLALQTSKTILIFNKLSVLLLWFLLALQSLISSFKKEQ